MAETKGTRTPLVIALVVCVAISALSIASFSVAYGVDELETLDPVHDEVVDRQTDNSDAIANELKKYYPDMVEHLSDVEPATYAIPGLVRAKNIRARGDDKGTVDYADDMTPQGLAITDDYVIVSAYSKSKDFYSVLWVLNRATRDFVKTVVLDNCDHVGGLAYDADRDRLWVAAKQPGGGAAALGCFSMDDIDTYNFDESGTTLPYDDIVVLKGIEHTSFVTYFDNIIYAGDFNTVVGGTLGCYELDDRGYPTSGGDDADGVAPKRTVSIPDEIQGITFTEGMIILSQSWGPHDAHLMGYIDTDVDDLDDLTYDNCVFDEVMPPYLEQIKAVGTDLYVVFESSAKEYRGRKGVFGIDHVLKLDITEILEGAQRP